VALQHLAALETTASLKAETLVDSYGKWPLRSATLALHAFATCPLSTTRCGLKTRLRATATAAGYGRHRRSGWPFRGRSSSSTTLEPASVDRAYGLDDTPPQCSRRTHLARRVCLEERGPTTRADCKVSEFCRAHRISRS